MKPKIKLILLTLMRGIQAQGAYDYGYDELTTESIWGIRVPIGRYKIGNSLKLHSE